MVPGTGSRYPSCVWAVGVGSASSGLWDLLGNAMVMTQYIRLTPDVQSKQGAVWNRVVSPGGTGGGGVEGPGPGWETPGWGWGGAEGEGRDPGEGIEAGGTPEEPVQVRFGGDFG